MRHAKSLRICCLGHVDRMDDSKMPKKRSMECFSVQNEVEGLKMAVCRMRRRLIGGKYQKIEPDGDKL